MKKIVIGLVLIGGVLSLVWYMNEPSKVQSDEPVQVAVNQVIQPPQELVPVSSIQAPNTVVENNENVIDEVVDAGIFSGISRVSDTAKAVLQEAGVLPTDLAGEAYIEFDLKSLRALEIGDTFDLEIPQTSMMFSAEVTEVQKFENGDKSIVGRMVGSEGEFNTTVITVGEDAVYGQFTTTGGNYVFESKNQYGWIAAKRDLYKNHVEFEPTPSGETTTGEDDIFNPENKSDDSQTDK